MVVSLAIRPGIINSLGNRREDLAGVGFWAANSTSKRSSCRCSSRLAKSKGA